MNVREVLIPVVGNSFHVFLKLVGGSLRKHIIGYLTFLSVYDVCFAKKIPILAISVYFSNANIILHSAIIFAKMIQKSL